MIQVFDKYGNLKVLTNSGSVVETDPIWLSEKADYLTIVSANATYALASHTHAFSAITSKPTTLSGYGITDAVPSSRTITINGTTYDLSANRSWTISASSVAWSSITGKPTTLSGYGITDAYPLTGNPSGFLTSYTETDPVFTTWLATVPNISAFTNNVGYLTSLGSGTTNYVTKWTTGGTVLGNSLIFDNGTNVGIANTSPSYKLDVTGTINSSSTITASTSMISPIVAGGTLTTATLTLSGTNQVSDASTIYIQPNAGNILVGKTSGTTLGTFKIVYRDTSGSASGTHFGLYNNEIATNDKGGSISFGDNAGNNVRAFIKGAFAGTGSGGYLALSTSSSANTLTEGLRINYTQNVLIGTSTDSGFKLDVNGTVRAQTSITLGTATTSNGRINLSEAGTTIADSISWNDVAIYRGSANTLYIGQLSTTTRNLRISPQATGASLIAGGSSATPYISFATTQTNSATVAIGGTDNNILMSKAASTSAVFVRLTLSNVASTGNILELANSVGTVTSFNISGNMSSPLIKFGTGSPEGVVTAGIGCLYSRTDGGANTTLYVKESGSGNTGWVAK